MSIVHGSYTSTPVFIIAIGHWPFFMQNVLMAIHLSLCDEMLAGHTKARTLVTVFHPFPPIPLTGVLVVCIVNSINHSLLGVELLILCTFYFAW